MSDSLFARWTATVGRAPKALAVIDAPTGQSWTRAALAASVADWADSLGGTGSGSRLTGSRVAMSLENGSEWFRVFLGLLSAGAVPVLIDPSEPEAAQAEAARAAGARSIWRKGGLHDLGPARTAGTRLRPNECLVKMTSGSTGTPKGLPATHAQMEADGRQICRAMGIGANDANLAAIPLGYSYGLGSLVLPLLIQGTRVICTSSSLPHAIAADCARHRPTVFPSVPPVLRALAASDVHRRSLATLRLVVSAGSPLANEVSQDFESKFGLRIRGFYGTSETGGIAFDESGGATLSGRGVGRPIAGVTIAFGKRGRFTVSSPAVLGKGSFSPSDRGGLNERGELVLHGRTDRVVKIAGRRVELAEVEAALRAVPGIRDAFAHMPAGPDAALAAAVATDMARAEVRRHLRGRIASWKVPSRIATLPEFPVTPRGKTDTRRLRQLLSAPRIAASISTLSAERQISAPR